MINSIFEKINFLKSRGDHCHFLKRNYFFFTKYDSFSYSTYKGIISDKIIVKSIVYEIFIILIHFNIKYLVKLFIFGKCTLILLCTK